MSFPVEKNQDSGPLSPEDAPLHTAWHIGRLDQALSSHPLRLAWLWRARLTATCRLTHYHGAAITPWQLAATLARLPIHLPGLRPVERGTLLEATRLALSLWQQLGQLPLASLPLSSPTELARKVSQGHIRPLDVPGHLHALGWTRSPYPILLGLSSAEDPSPSAFWTALAQEAEDGYRLLTTLHWTRQEAHAQVDTKTLARAIDAFLVFPLLSAKGLAPLLQITERQALRVIDRLCAKGLLAEASHRRSFRLFHLATFPIGEATAPPRRPLSSKRGRPPKPIPENPVAANEEPSSPLPPLPSFHWEEIDETSLAATIAEAEAAIRRANTLLAGRWNNP